MTEDTLPDRPSALIRLALDDLRKVETDERYVVDMHDWHHTVEAQCRVCLAGAVMAREFEVPVGMSLSPFSFPWSIRGKLIAIDQFRRGHVGAGLTYMSPEGQWGKIPWNRYIPPYNHDREAFYAAMSQLASEFEAVGL